MLLPIRLVRDSLPNASIVAAIEALNDDLAEDIERIVREHPSLGHDLTAILLDAAWFAGAMLQGGSKAVEGGRPVFTEGLHERISRAAHALGPMLANPLHRHAINVAVAELKAFVGKDSAHVYAALRERSI